MKRIFFVFTLFVILSFLIINNKGETEVIKKESNEVRGIFVSYIELGNYIKGKNKKESKENIDNIIKNASENKFNTIILQVRSHNDAIYNSKMFKQSSAIILEDGTYYDVLKYFLQQCKKNKIKLFAWMNPYRIGKEENISKEDWKSTSNIQNINGVYYYNPASIEVQDYLTQAVGELAKNYDVDAILFDDYFYPSQIIDKEEYKKYLENNKFITREDFHLLMVNNFIKKVYKEIKKENKAISFGISPEGNIENNYSKNYADVKKWTSEKGYIDFIMPQLYYGFFNGTKPYYDTLKEWNELIKNDKVALYLALSFYKVGIVDEYAKEGSNEWINNKDIIKRQILLARSSKKYKGFALFRYDNLFNKNNENQNTKQEFKNVISILE